MVDSIMSVLLVKLESSFEAGFGYSLAAKPEQPRRAILIDFIAVLVDLLEACKGASNLAD